MQAAPAEKLASPTDKLALFAVCAIGFAFSTNYTNHAPMATALAARFGFNLAAAGLLTTAIFLTHAAMQIPGGSLADRFGPKPVIAAAAAVICLGNIAIGFSSGYWGLFFWKMFIGLGTGAGFVSGARYIATTFAGPRLHLAQGMYGGSVLLGSGFVIFAVPSILRSYGWQVAFLASAGLAASAGALWIVAPVARAIQHKRVNFGGMLSSPQLWLLGLAQMASFGLVIVVGTWVTTYLGAWLELRLAGRIGSLVLLLGIATRPLGGILVARLGARRTLLLSLALNTIGCLALGSGHRSILQATLGILLLGVGCGLPYAAVFNRAAALFPARAGAAMGMVNMLGIIMILAAPPAIGQMVEWFGNFQLSFLALAGFTAMAWLAMFAVHQHESDRSV